MTNAFMENMLSAAGSALIAVYVLLGLIVVAGIVTVIRLAALIKLRSKAAPKAAPEKDCENCEKVNALNEEIERLEDRVKELEKAPTVVYVEQERTLKESLADAKEVGSVGKISKKSIIAYLTGKYGDAVEINGRHNRTANGKLLVSDNHFAFAPDGKKVCFTYVYETDEGQVLSLVKLPGVYAAALAKDHSNVMRSNFPKNKEKDWYSVIADDSFTEESYYAVFDAAIARVAGTFTAEEAPAPIEEKSLKESLAVAKESGAAGTVSKASIMAHLAATFNEKVELNGRQNRTASGKLLVSDNHFAFAPDGKRVCFTYVYQDDDGKIVVLVKTSASYASAPAAAHGSAVSHSAFPKNKARDWYSVVVDDTFTEKQVYDFLDDAVRLILGEAPALRPAAELAEKTLKESIAATKEVGAVGKVSKQSIMAYLSAKYGDAVELNGRQNRTNNGKLLVSDNHFAFAPDGKRVCFTYIYQTDEGNIVSLVKLDAGYASALAGEHPHVTRSAFPKNKEKDWYSVIADDTFTEEGYYAVFDAAIATIAGKAPAAVPAAAAIVEPEEKTLKESIAAAKEKGAVGNIDKKSIMAYLSKEYGSAVELNGRQNRTANGKLLDSDNHFAFAPVGKRVCFTYIYQTDEGNIVSLVKLEKTYASALAKEHPHVTRSAFPKNKEKDWYSVIADDTFTEEGYYAVFDAAIASIAGKAPAAVPTAVTVPAPAEAPAQAEPAPAPAPVTEEKSLKESIAAAKLTGAIDKVSKRSIVAYLDEKYEGRLELHSRRNRTDSGKLLVSDNHFAFAPDGKRVCFSYIYQTDEGHIVSLVKLDADYAAALAAVHPCVARSAFPKNKEKDWYSVIADDTFNEGTYYAVFDAAIATIEGREPDPVQ